MAFYNIPTDVLKKKIDEVLSFLSVTLRIANAHTVDFYTGDVWHNFMAVSPDEVLLAVNNAHEHMVAPTGKLLFPQVKTTTITIVSSCC